MMTTKRRRASVWVLALGALVAAGPSRAADVPERKNVDDLSAHELEVYKHAIDVLMRRADAAENYQYYADLHNVFGSNPPHGCEHRNELFFPWHRYHLHVFEQALRASDPDHPTLSTKDVTIPYWDWSRRASGARFPKAFEEPGSPLSSDLRNPGASEPLFTPEYLQDLIEDNGDWNAYAGGPQGGQEYYGAFEQPAHNEMHGSYIGGDMGDPTTAAYDPIYWSFHAFIDLQWDRWQKAHGASPTCLDCVLRGFRDGPTTNAVVSVEALGYRYAIPPPVHAESLRAKAPRRALRPESIVLKARSEEAERTVAAWGGAGPFVFQLARPRAQFERARLWLMGLRVPEALSYSLRVYIHPAGAANPLAERYLAGRFSFWRGHAGHTGDSAAFIGITGALRDVARSAPATKWLVTLVVAKLPAPRTSAARPKSVADSARPLAEDVQFRSVVVRLDDDVPSDLRPAGGGHHGER